MVLQRCSPLANKLVVLQGKNVKSKNLLGKSNNILLDSRHNYNVDKRIITLYYLIFIG